MDIDSITLYFNFTKILFVATNIASQLNTLDLALLLLAPPESKKYLIQLGLWYFICNYYEFKHQVTILKIISIILASFLFVLSLLFSYKGKSRKSKIRATTWMYDGIQLAIHHHQNRKTNLVIYAYLTSSYNMCFSLSSKDKTIQNKKY